MYKKPLLILVSGLFKLSLFGLAVAGAGWMTFGSPDTIKKAAENSNFYQGAVDGALEAAKQDASTNTNQDLPLDDPEIDKIVRESFPPELLSKNSDAILDGVYNWLRGEAKTPQFTVDISESKQTFAEKISAYAATKYESLPVCTLQQLQTINPATVDPFNAPCRAPQLPSSQVKDRVFNDIINNKTFLQDTTFSAEDLPKDEQGRTVIENLSTAPDAYQAFRIIPWILGVATLLLGLGIFSLTDSKRKAAKSIAIALIGNGLILAIGAYITMWSFKQMNTQVAGLSFQNSLINMLNELANTYNAALAKFYIPYLIIGGGIFFTLWYQKRNRAADNSNTVS